MRSNTEYKNAALAALKGNWAPAVLATVILVLLALVIALPGELLERVTDNQAVFLGFIGVQMLYMYLFLVPLQYIGYYNSLRLLYENGDDSIIHNMFDLTFKNYWHHVWVCFLMIVKILLWSLLFVIPGVIKALQYSMTPYIALEHPELSASEAIAMSRRMTKNHLFDIFWLGMSFIGWFLLGILTLFIGYLWLEPYMYTTFAAFYCDLKAEYLVGNSEA